jgi:hypothetical protein
MRVVSADDAAKIVVSRQTSLHERQLDAHRALRS